MQVGVMVTHGGPHPPQRLAEGTAWKIVDLIRVAETPVDPSLPETDRQAIENNRETFRQAKTRLEDGIKALIEAHHRTVQDHERGQLRQKGGARLAEPHDHPACDDLCRAVIAATKETVLEAHFARPETIARVAEILADDSAHTAHIERSWHADRHNGAAGG